ncbi:hypothetical protein QWI17_21730 [Gilvimarinus sp. SDUM040013]|uniref:Uncharacterized protein n=1 Tax=Gilvimarinus gilvus TaxID=3058038 RepID=A0ABU4RWM1_9GAMM|nr:hypothetical protein [Gilvimarinus sp. SDUM040013]MDO3388482.1 hypothetical protein [Gilvimarinus sp. SDUM040013]MDX6848646.1 hypothetical protein [Gilvimarinus sp. SDUM040013]
MTEFEISYLTGEELNRMWDIMQFWVSITFGLIAMSHIARRHLNVLLVGAVSVLYLLFSVFIFRVTYFNLQVLKGHLLDLHDFGANNLSAGQRHFIEYFPSSLEIGLGVMFAFVGLLICVLLFLWHNTIEQNKAFKRKSTKDLHKANNSIAGNCKVTT